jgi:hypothetical protein
MQFAANLKRVGGDEEDRTPGLGIANATAWANTPLKASIFLHFIF